MLERSVPSKYLHSIVRHGDTIYVAGVTASDRSADIRGQTREVIQKIGDHLGSAGSNLGQLLCATIYLVDLDMKDAMNEVWLAELGAALPTRATVGVADLGPNVLIEVVTVAAATNS